ncbi:hypothetical protein COCVIDRAFT_35291 [Bipolaris victoriae FI3]|uniref:Uncharacterized protein n=1 Tax=Bipolaris victoriae (strain FI3) TaxID=930091 RepID=W7F107_BIPV3|nr:hypothetical protein COCVIDRAFT_35291 [Bipolaris victoriae FI3]
MASRAKPLGGAANPLPSYILPRRAPFHVEVHWLYVSGPLFLRASAAVAWGACDGIGAGPANSARQTAQAHTHMAAVTAGLVPTCNTVGGGGNSSGNGGGGGSMHIHVTLSLCCAVTSNQGWVQWVPPALPKGLSRRPGLTSWRNKRRTRNRGRLRGRSDSGFVWIMAGPVLALEG